MKKIRVAVFIILTVLLIFCIGMAVRKKTADTEDSNETFYEETFYEESFYEYEGSGIGNETEAPSSEDYIPTENK